MSGDGTEQQRTIRRHRLTGAAPSSPLGGSTAAAAVFAAAAAVLAVTGVIGANLLGSAGERSNWCQQGYELGREAVSIVDDGYSPGTACELMVSADMLRVGHRRTTAQTRQLKQGCLQAVQDLTR